jgi:hypothetical protein
LLPRYWRYSVDESHCLRHPQKMKCDSRIFPNGINISEKVSCTVNAVN